jgi:hypothetical protein
MKPDDQLHALAVMVMGAKGTVPIRKETIRYTV